MHRLLPPLGFAALLLASTAEAGLPFPSFNEEPLEASSFWALALPLASTLLTTRPGASADVSGDSSEGSSELSGADSRRLIAARADAAAFIATDGGHRGAQLEQALRVLRGLPAQVGQDDLQLAWQVLIYQLPQG